MKTPGFWFNPPGVLSTLLQPLGQLYYRLGRLRRQQPVQAHVPLIVVGNIVAGGAGKTPVVLALTKLLQQRGLKVHLMAKGYGGRLKGPLLVDPAQHSAADVGDEPLLLAAAAPTFIGHDRGEALQLAAVDADIVISDDGLQSQRLQPDLALLVFDGVLRFGNGQLIPAGPLREPFEQALKRVHALVQIGGAEQKLCFLPHLVADFVPTDISWMRGARVVAFAGIGQPEKFFATCTTSGAEVLAIHAFADHHPYTREEIRTLIAAADAKGAIVVTTTKDAVKVPPDLRAQLRVIDGELVWRHFDHINDLLDGFLTRYKAGHE